MNHFQPSLPSGLGSDVMCAGDGPPLVFLHNHLGQAWDEFLEALSANFSVFAPQLPGIEEPDELERLDGFADLALYYDDLLNALGLEDVVLVGHAFGGMVAAELAAHCPARVRRLVLIDSLGLWRDDIPIADIASVAQPAAAAMLSGSEELTTSLLSPPADPDQLAPFMIGRFMTQAAVSHFIWPIPDRNLRRRLYRLVMPTLVVWGEADTHVPLAYASEFTDNLPDAQQLIVSGAGHMPQLERTDEVVASITSFAS